MKALIDGDIFQWEFGSATDDEFKPLSWPLVQARIQGRINGIMEATGADEYQIYLTSEDKSNFRFDIASIRPYKGHRTTEKPHWYTHIRNFLVDQRGAEEVFGQEADDAMSIAQYRSLKENGVRLYASNGKYAILDWEDYLWAKDYTWSICSNNYVFRGTNVQGDSQKIYLHRELINPDGDQVVDHINRNPLDNRRCNLRACSLTENCKNSSTEKSLSKYKGVSYDKDTGKWRPSIRVNGKLINFSRCDTEEEAARIYDEAAKEHFGEYAYLNFPVDTIPEFTETIICSRDKDLNMVPGNHYTWGAGKQKEQSAWYQDEIGGLRSFYKQLLTGDSVDNIPGLYGVGKSSTLLKALDEMDNEECMYGHVLTQYKLRFGSYAEQFLTENGILLWMRSEEGEIWTPPKITQSQQ